MISAKSLSILLLVLGVSSSSSSSSSISSVAAAKTQFNRKRPNGVASIRGRVLQDSDDLDELPSEEDESGASVEDEEESASKDSGDAKFSARNGLVAPSKRKCTSKQSKGKVQFECKASTEDGTSKIKDKIKFNVGATKGDFLKIKVEYETKFDDFDTDVEEEIKTQYTLVYDRIIEYRNSDEGNDEHYEWGVDEVVAEWPMDTWDTLSDLETVGDSLTFSASDGVATFSFTISQTDSVDLTTNKMKIDFLLENYPWDESGDTFVALVSHIETERKTKIDRGKGKGNKDEVSEVLIDFEEAVDTIGFVPFGDYSWETTAEATNFVESDIMVNGTDTDGGDEEMIAIERIGGDADNFTGLVGLSDITETISVIASSAPITDDSEFTEIAFSFVGAAQGADRIYWDPEAGVGYGSSAAGRLVAVVAMAAASFATVFLVW